MIYSLMIAIPILLIISLIFYVLGSMISAFEEGYTVSSTNNRSPQQQAASEEDGDSEYSASLPKGELF